MTNVIRIRQTGEAISPTQTIDRLHALCEKLKQVKDDALLLDQALQRDSQTTSQSLVARGVARETVVLTANGLELITDAIAELIVETAADLIVPRSPVNI